MDALYKVFRKPFVIAEQAPRGYDSPGFAQRMFAWPRNRVLETGSIPHRADRLDLDRQLQEYGGTSPFPQLEARK